MSFSLSGIASGMDTATIISELMKLERIPYNKLEARQVTYNNELSVFRAINTKLATLRTAADELRFKNTFDMRSAISSDESVLKVFASETAVQGDYQIEVVKLATQHTASSKTFAKADAPDDDLLGGKVTIWHDGSPTDITLSGETNEQMLNNLVDQINGQIDGIRASLIETSPGNVRLVLQAAKSGTANEINVGVGNGTEEGIYIAFLDKDDVEIDLDFEHQHAQDAELKINGIDVTASSNELNNVVTGLSFSLLKTGTVHVTAARDVDKIADKVEAFVHAYNDVVNTIRSQNGKEARLQGDFTLRSLQEQLANMLTGRVGPQPTPEEEGVEGVFRYLFDIGLEVDKGVTKASDMTGTIQFDKEKFRQALQQNPDGVYELFAHNEENNSSESGVAQRFNELLQVWTRSATGILAARIDGYNEQIKFVEKQMESMEMRLALREEQLKKQFVAMEVALSSLNSQMAWLTSQISSMSSFNQQQQ